MTALDESRPFGVPPRTPVQFDPAAHRLRIGEHEREIADPSVPTQVYTAYLSLLHAVRGTQPGAKLPLRSADLEALLLIVGDDPETIEQRLIGLMGISAQEASVLGGLLLRHRRSMAAFGAVAALAVGVGTTAVGSDAVTAPSAVESVSAPSTVIAPEPAPVAAVDPVTVQAAAPVVGPATGVSRPARATAVTSEPSVTSVSLTGTSTTTPPAVAADVPAAPAPAAAAPAAPTMVPEPDGVVWDAPPPEPEAPSSDIGEAASLFPEEPTSDVGEPVSLFTPIQGTTDSSETLPAEEVAQPDSEAPAPSDSAGTEGAPVPAALPEGHTPISGTTMSDGHEAPLPEGHTPISGTTMSDGHGSAEEAPAVSEAAPAAADL